MNYKNSRDAAWEMLIKHNITALPVSVQKVCKREHIKLLTYKEGEKVIKKFGLTEHTIGNDAFCVGKIIFYDDTTTPQRQRFSVAHEIGHIVLHQPKEATTYNREMSPSDNPIESEANVFASRLLAPLCVLHFIGVQSPEEISELCNISITAAKIRYERLCEIRAREKEMVRKTGRGCFLLSPLEREVFHNFGYYIKEKRK